MLFGPTSLPPTPVAASSSPSASVSLPLQGRATNDETSQPPATYVEISQAGRQRAGQGGSAADEANADGAGETDSVFGEKQTKTDQAANDSASESKARASTDQSELSDDERRQLDELEARDREVRTHEQAHKSAGGQYAGAIHLEYQRGPDGQRYAVGGHVPIDVSPIKGDPSATIKKMAVVRRAAMAPADPSGADRQVAAKASAYAAEAQADLATQRYTQAQEAAPAGAKAAGSESQPGASDQGADATSPHSAHAAMATADASGPPERPSLALVA